MARNDGNGWALSANKGSNWGGEMKGSRTIVDEFKPIAGKKTTKRRRKSRRK